MEILTKIIDFFKSIFQSSDKSIVNTSIKLNQNKNNGSITNNIGVKPTVKKNTSDNDYTLDFDGVENE